MKTPSKSDLPAKLAQGRRRFEKWRNNQETRTRLPEHLWSLAADLAREYGLSRTARILRLDYNGLKSRIERPASDEAPPVTATPAFLELLPAGTNAAVECTIECESVRGTRLRIHLQSQELPDLIALSQALWSQDR